MGLWWKKLINFQSTCQKCHAKMSGGKGDEKAAALPWELCLFPGPELTPYRESWLHYHHQRGSCQLRQMCCSCQSSYKNTNILLHTSVDLHSLLSCYLKPPQSPFLLSWLLLPDSLRLPIRAGDLTIRQHKSGRMMNDSGRLTGKEKCR